MKALFLLSLGHVIKLLNSFITFCSHVIFRQIHFTLVCRYFNILMPELAVPNYLSCCIILQRLTFYCRQRLIKFLPQPHLWGLRLVLLFWGGTARVQEVMAIAWGIDELGVLSWHCKDGLSAAGHIGFSGYHQTSNSSCSLSFFCWFVRNKGVLISLLCLFI